jgi:hypothetical protein
LSSWHKPSDCLWSTTIEIEGKTAINSLYRDLRHFFVEKLRVPTLNLKLVYDELTKTHLRDKPVEDVKALLWALNSLLRSEQNHPDPAHLLNSRILPVRAANDQISLHSINADFAINDREAWFKHLKGSGAKFLDYSLQEVRRLEPFITWTGLSGKYLSKCIFEETKLKGGAATPISCSRYDLKNKAYALLRYLFPPDLSRAAC